MKQLTILHRQKPDTPAARSASENTAPRGTFRLDASFALEIVVLGGLVAALLCSGIVTSTRASGSPRSPHASSKAAPQTSSKNAAITGRVLDDSGKPISGADVYVARVGTRIGARNSVTDDDGKFAISDLAAAPYQLIVSAPAFVDVARDDTGLESLYRPGDSADITLAKGGVITGMVRDQDNNPVVAIEVQAIRIKDADGRRTVKVSRDSTSRTDDRGIYRIYGLRSGSYLVYAGGPAGWRQGIAYIGDGPTYYPSATIDTAQEVPVSLGQELTGIDIGYRGGKGYEVTGAVSDSLASANEFEGNDDVMLRQPVTGNVFAQAFANSNGPRSQHARTFSFSGVPDGQYEIVAIGFKSSELVRASAPIKITVKGSDVTGLNLTVTALASISGTVTLEPLPEAQKAACKTKPVNDFLKQTAVTALPDRAEGTLLLPYEGRSLWGAVDEKGHFTISGLPAGTYHLEIAPPNDSWYVRVVEKQDLPAGRATPAGGGSQRSPNPQTRPATAGKAPSAGSGIEVKAGQALENISMTLSEGAARLAGRVSAQAAKNASAQDSAATLRAYLVPSGPAEQKNPLCFMESAVNHDGSFEVSRIPPGKYHLVLRPDPPIKEQLGPIRKAAWDISLQRKLISQAQKQTAELELSTCGRVTGYSLDPVPSAPAPTPAAPRD